MDSAFDASFIKIIIFLPVVLLLIYISLRLGGSQIMKIGGGKLIKVIERVPVSSKSFLCIAIINEKPYVISSTEEKIEILMELPVESLEKLKQSQDVCSNFKDNLISNFKALIKGKDRL